MRFGVYYDDAIPTSGRRFFGRLHHELSSHADFRATGYDVILCNISVPIRRMLIEKVRGARVALRVDGLYFDALSERHLRTFSWPMRMLLRGLRAMFGGDLAADVANFANGNWSAFIRMLIADHIIYQSVYSRQVYERYFPRKPSSIVVNGDQYHGEVAPERDPADAAIRIATVFDSWKPAKRMGETVEFVRWANEEKGRQVAFTLLGYTGSFSADTPPGIKDVVEQRPYIKTLPRFAAYEGAVAEALEQADIYLTFSFRDPCPNVVVESMAHGLPVVAIDSGGIPDIVGDAGILLPGNDDEAYFTSSRYDGGFPPIDFERVLEAVLTVARNQAEFRSRVRRRFDEDLGIAVVAERYVRALEAAAK